MGLERKLCVYRVLLPTVHSTVYIFFFIFLRRRAHASLNGVVYANNRVLLYIYLSALLEQDYTLINVI